LTEGGDVDPDKAYLVGERGPEILLSKDAGTVIPNHALGGSRISNQTVNNHVANVTVNTTGGGSSALNQDLAERVGRSVQNSMRTMIMQEIRTQQKPGGVLSG
jgi:phage-related minor tail protein